MTVDTRDKRASVLLFDIPFSRVWPNPDGSIANVEDRTHMAWKYGSLVISASAAAGTARFRTLMGVGQ